MEIWYMHIGTIEYLLPTWIGVSLNDVIQASIKALQYTWDLAGK
jgi:hypothetical protein